MGEAPMNDLDPTRVIGRIGEFENVAKYRNRSFDVVFVTLY